MKIITIQDNGDYLRFLLEGEEDLVGTYYLHDLEEKENLLSTLKYGMRVRFVGSLKEPSHNTIPNTFDYKEYLQQKNIYYQLRISELEVVDEHVSFLFSLKNMVYDRIQQIDTTGYMLAFLLGDKSSIDTEVYDAYQSIGITHLFALSGMHVGLLSGILLKLLKKVPVALRYGVVCSLLIGYGFLVGFPASIQRAILFFLLSSINKVGKLDIPPFRIFLLTVWFLVFIHYKILWDIGFLYSAFTVGGILLCSSFIQDESKIKNAFKLSLVAFLFSLPITLISFYEVNFLSIVYNLFFIPYVSIFVYPLSLISFFFPIICPVFWLSIRIMEGVALLLKTISFCSFCLDFEFWEVFLFYLFLVFLFYKQNYKVGIFLVLLFLGDLLAPYFDSNAYVYFFDVGQGDSSLIISPYRKSVFLVDTGGNVSFENNHLESKETFASDGVLTFLKSKGIKKIDVLLLTHGDYDHMGEAAHLVSHLSIQKVIFNFDSYNALEHELIRVLEEKNIPYSKGGTSLEDAYYKIQFLYTRTYDNENDNSNVFSFSCYQYQFLFMGDASIEREKDLLEKYRFTEIDFLKVGHHGSATSTSPSFIEAIRPKYSIISVGRKNRYGHPNDEVLENLNRSKIYRTDQDGSIMFKFKKDKIEIETCPP